MGMSTYDVQQLADLYQCHLASTDPYNGSELLGSVPERCGSGQPQPQPEPIVVSPDRPPVITINGGIFGRLLSYAKP